MKRRPLRLAPCGLVALAIFTLLGCKGSPSGGEWCSTATAAPAPAAHPVTYYRDIQPLAMARCSGCHVQGGIAPFPLQRYEDFTSRSGAIGASLRERHMPPWLAARCCAEYRNDLSLTEEELGLFERWLQDGLPAGQPEEAPAVPPLAGLSRVDLTLTMPEGFVPQPPPGSVDETRCFVLDWPLQRPVYITGLNPRPGNRSVVHHLIVGAVGPADAQQLMGLEGQDGRPGFECAGGFGSVRNIKVLGGSLVGSDFPDGLGTLVEPGTKILLNIHYSVAYSAPAPDQTSIELRVDDKAREAKAMVIANPAWLVADAMLVKAGEEDVPFWFRFRPTLFTGGKRVYLRSVAPHMHAFGHRLAMRVLRKDGSRQCLLEIPEWDSSWEQPYWFARPIELEPEDELYLECRFDNSAANQPAGQQPRDIAWGESNQDMCAGFLSYTEEP